MPTNEILQYLKTQGERLDTDIAKATGISLAAVRLELAELAARCEVVACHSIRFVKGKKIE
jgi:predicted ArsR family transcriptional regulator